MTSPRSPRDVLAALVERWVPDDDDLYGQYVDPLLNALDREGWEIVAREKERVDHLTEEPDGPGATLLLAVYIPEDSEDNGPDEAADSLIEAINYDRRRAGGEPLEINLWPAPQWFTARTLDVLRRADELTPASPIAADPTTGTGT